MKDIERRENGLYYSPMDTGDSAYTDSTALLKEINRCYKYTDLIRPMISLLFGSFDPTSTLVAPLFVDLGHNISVGAHSFINTEFLALDEGKITIGDYVQIGPRCSIYTACHPLDAKVRMTGLETAKDVTIEDGVWIGGSVTIVGGVTIGKGSVIGAGSVVTKSIPEGVIAAGNPCRVIRSLSEQEIEKEQEMLQAYLDDPDTPMNK